MRLLALSTLFAFAVAFGPPSNQSPFEPALFGSTVLLSNGSIVPDDGPDSRDDGHNDLRKRDGGCPGNYNSCSTLSANYAAACCATQAICSLDSNSQVACCTIGATCTGTISVGGAAATTAGVVSTTTTTTGTGTATITSGPSFVQNSYFPFPIIPTSYANSAACVSAYDICSSNYALCTADLQGVSQAEITINAPNGGTTVVASATNLGLASATSICSSLSSVACYNLATSDCAEFGTSAGMCALISRIRDKC